MKTPDSVFDLNNDGEEDMRLFLEPEGQDFWLPPGKTVQVRLFGADRPIVMKYSTGPDGEPQVSFWPENGDYELIFEGRDVWDLV
ncbi:hypothetical protein CDL60_05080 [Roseateles noduli]|nr:hypothetical protein CDL60_05080 [Roseateles noduli]